MDESVLFRKYLKFKLFFTPNYSKFSKLLVFYQNLPRLAIKFLQQSAEVKTSFSSTGKPNLLSMFNKRPLDFSQVFATSKIFSPDCLNLLSRIKQFISTHNINIIYERLFSISSYFWNALTASGVGLTVSQSIENSVPSNDTMTHRIFAKTGA